MVKFMPGSSDLAQLKSSRKTLTVSIANGLPRNARPGRRERVDTGQLGNGVPAGRPTPQRRPAPKAPRAAPAPPGHQPPPGTTLFLIQSGAASNEFGSSELPFPQCILLCTRQLGSSSRNRWIVLVTCMHLRCREKVRRIKHVAWTLHLSTTMLIS